MFQPVFQAGMQAEAGRTLASTAGGCPADLSKWVREGGTVEALARDFVWFGTGCKQLEEEVCVGGCVSSDFTLASCLSQFYSGMEHMLCSALYVSRLRFLSPNQSCYESTLASLLKCFKTLTCRKKSTEYYETIASE